MDISNLNEKIKGLISYLRETGYSAMYINYVEKMAEWLSENFDHYKWKTPVKVEHTLKELWPNKCTYRNKVRLLRIICQYVEKGLLPDGRKHYVKPHHYELLGEEYRNVTDMACNVVSERCKSSKNVKYALSSFFFRLQEMGICSFESITEDAVLDMFSQDGRLGKSHSLKYSVEYGLKACLPHYGQSIERIIAYLPSIPNRRKNIQYLTEQELAAIKYALENDNTISLQDKAIITLAIYTGLRGCDISALTLDSLDWEHDLIKITQTKTGQSLTLPLRAVVGNAIFDYLLNERPQCQEPYVFLTVRVPHRRLHTSNLDAICSKVMCKAGIRQGENERKSIHLFRHHVATSLLQAGVQQPVISATLGHASPDSIDRYLSAEFKRLKECSLSIKGFPVGKGVFGG